MTCELSALSIAASDPVRLLRFWAGVLDRPTTDDGRTLRPTDETGIPLRFRADPGRKVRPNPMHLDLTSTSADDQRRTVARALELGAQHLDVGQRPEEGHVVLADPEGNELCVLEPGNSFLADCGFVGALACDGSRAAGCFWSEVLGWPLVWDQDQETAVRSPRGGPKITWSGAPPLPAAGNSRVHLDLAPSQSGGHEAETDRLLTLGATYVDGHRGEPGWLTLADPDGQEFWLAAAR